MNTDDLSTAEKAMLQANPTREIWIDGLFYGTGNGTFPYPLPAPKGNHPKEDLIAAQALADDYEADLTNGRIMPKWEREQKSSIVARIRKILAGE